MWRVFVFDCILLTFFLFLPIERFGTKKISHEFLENLSDSYLIFFFLCCRWTMDEMQVEYLKPTRHISVGIYGWRKRCLYGLLIILTLVVLINLCLTFWLSVALGLHWVRWEGLLLGWMTVFFSREVSDRSRSSRIMSSFERLLCWKTVWSPARFSVVNRSVDTNELLTTMMTTLCIAIEYSIGPKCTYSKWFEWEALHSDSW